MTSKERRYGIVNHIINELDGLWYDDDTDRRERDRIETIIGKLVQLQIIILDEPVK